MDSPTELPQELVEQFVIAAHGDLGRVQELYAVHPGLLDATWQKLDETAIQAAGHTGQRRIAEFLLAEGAPLNVYAAAMLGLRDRVAAFLEREPALAATPGVHGISLMFHAAMSGDPAVAELVLGGGGGGSIDAALHGAARFGHAAMVEWLLGHGVEDINVLNFEHKTPLQVARKHGHHAVVDLLLRHGAATGEA
ncbi:MAG TPA: ankyrin repeat domain-containing protein [Herpetosiphonaceae bacterium]